VQNIESPFVGDVEARAYESFLYDAFVKRQTRIAKRPEELANTIEVGLFRRTLGIVLEGWVEWSRGSINLSLRIGANIGGR
jgi:hypothetical protein